MTGTAPSDPIPVDDLDFNSIHESDEEQGTSDESINCICTFLFYLSIFSFLKATFGNPNLRPLSQSHLQFPLKILCWKEFKFNWHHSAPSTGPFPISTSFNGGKQMVLSSRTFCHMPNCFCQSRPPQFQASDFFLKLDCFIPIRLEIGKIMFFSLKLFQI